MKTNKILNRISTLALAAAALFVAPALTACSSDSEPAPEPEPVPEGMARVNLSIAAPHLSGTRAGEEAPVTAEETKINDLWVYFYLVKDDNTTELRYAFDITGGSLKDGTVEIGTGTKPTNLVQTGSNSNNNEYTTVINGLNIQKGKYKIYVLANINQFLGTNSIKPSDNPTETTLTGAALTMTTDEKPIIKNLKRALPMAANYDAVTKDNDATGGVLDIQESATIKATMTFLVSKVRYTIFFDNTVTTNNGTTTYGYSYPWTNVTIDDNIEFQKVAKKTGLFGTVSNQEYTNISNNDGSGVGLTFDPKTVTFDSFVASTEIPASFTEKTTNKTGSLAFQQDFYITENLQTANSNKSKIDLMFTFDSNVWSQGNDDREESKNYTLTLPNTNTSEGAANTLERGNFYDIVGKITADGFDFQVKVRKWVVTNRTIGEL